jgi:hypothetical protein
MYTRPRLSWRRRRLSGAQASDDLSGRRGAGSGERPRLGDDTNSVVLADEDIVSGGRVGLVATDLDGSVLDVWTVPAKPSKVLGNQLPGAIIPPRSPLAEELGLRPSPYTRVALDGRGLSVEELDEVAATLAAAAPAVNFSVERGPMTTAD